MAKKRLFQFSLRTMLVLFLVAGICGGVWNQLIAPVRQQWAAIEPILDSGGRIETKPSNVPEWLEFLLEEGKTKDIEAVYLRWPDHLQPVTDETIEALKRLPHLKTLEIPRVRLKPKHIEVIAKLTQLEHLNMSENRRLARADLTAMTGLKNLKTLDIRECGDQDWRTLLAFRENDQVTIGHSFTRPTMTSITSADIDDRMSIKQLLHPEEICHPKMKGASAATLKKVREFVPEEKAVSVDLTENLDLAFLKEFRRLNQENPFKLNLYLANTNAIPVATQTQRLSSAIRLVWQEFGSLADELVIETDNRFLANSESRSDREYPRLPESNHFILRSTGATEAFEIDIFFNEDYDLASGLKGKLPDLLNVKSFTFSRFSGKQISGYEPLLYKIPNVTEVTARKPGAHQQEFWRPLSQMQHVRKFSIQAPRIAGVLKSFPKNFPNGFKLQNTLTHFSMQNLYPEEAVPEELAEVFPNLKLFKYTALKNTENLSKDFPFPKLESFKYLNGKQSIMNK